MRIDNTLTANHSKTKLPMAWYKTVASPLLCTEDTIVLHKDIKTILIGQCKKDVTPLLTQWSYKFLALTHQYVEYAIDLLMISFIQTGKPLRWRHNGHDSISNHQPHDCLLNRLFRRRSKKTSKLHITGLCAGNSPGTGDFPAQMASNAENVSIWWHHHAMLNLIYNYFWPRQSLPDSKVHGAYMGPTWVLSAPAGPHIGPMNLAIKAVSCTQFYLLYHTQPIHTTGDKMSTQSIYTTRGMISWAYSQYWQWWEPIIWRQSL